MAPSKDALSFKAKLDSFLKPMFDTAHAPHYLQFLEEEYRTAYINYNPIAWQYCLSHLNCVLRHEHQSVGPSQKAWRYALMSKCYLMEATFHHLTWNLHRLEHWQNKAHKAAHELQKQWFQAQRHSPSALPTGVHSLCGEVGSALTNPGISSSHPAITNMADESFEIKLQIDSFREVEYLCGEMLRRIGRENPRERFQEVKEPGGGTKFLWTIRMTDTWLAATD
ncbi:MAG: hypothetical protein Q9188_004057 [Gyalolechia gomerana]